MTATGAPEPGDAAAALADAIEGFVTAVGFTGDPQAVTITIAAGDTTRVITVAAGDTDWLADYVNAENTDVTARLEHPEDDLGFELRGL